MILSMGEFRALNWLVTTFNPVLNSIDVRLLRGYTYCKCKSTQVAESVVSWNNLLLAVAGLETMSKKNSKLDAACRKNAKLSDVILKLEAEKGQ